MKISKLGAFALAALLSFGSIASAQPYNSGGFQSVAAPSVVATPISGSLTISTACATPLTPKSCASTSYAIFDMTAGYSGYGYQFNATNGAVFQTESSIDCTNFSTTNVEIGGGSPSSLSYASSFSTPGNYAGLGGLKACIAVVATTAPSTATTFSALLSGHDSGTVVRAAVPMTVANSAFGITGALAASGGPVSATGVSALVGGCVYNTTAPTPTTGQVLPLQCSPTGGLDVSGSFTATTSFPYTLVSSGQTAQGASGVGVLGVYNSSAPTLTTGQAAPFQLDANGNLDVDVKVGGGSGGGGSYPYSGTAGAQTATSASFAGAGGIYNATTPTLTNGQFLPLQLNASGALITTGTFSGTLTPPYNATAQSATNASFIGVAGQYNSTAPSLTNGQVIGLQTDVNGNLKVTSTASVAGFPYAATTGQTSSSASFLGAACEYVSAAPTLTTGQIDPILCDAAGNQYVDIAAGPGSSSANPMYTRNGTSSAVQTVQAVGTIATTAGAAITQAIGAAYIPSSTNFQNFVGDLKTGATVEGAVQVVNTGGAAAPAVIGTSASTTCTAVETNTSGRIVSIINTSTSAQTATVSVYDEGASPTCAAADLRYSVVLTASQVVKLDINVANGIAYQVSAAPSSNVLITRN